ncbi:hypothetical protein [Microbacterium trichothecenolyticum]|uniref:Lipoprotein n=1 Tax=Microbacterium trichothecenolyticum TaxID=69370 RepID=A0ABU0TRD0_MICTR|nr:hypothetical protein [Microbacterium trichothecenolyticum]MDQ1122231.1 hypothetical protein [Microbacterium trichothecenolyticum]
MRIRGFGVVAVLLSSSLLVACTPPVLACPAIGFVYTDPVKLEISSEALGDGSVAACFGSGCEPTAIVRGEDGTWEVPPVAPYVASDTVGLDPGDHIRIVVVDGSGEVTRDEVIEIPYTTTSDGFCPGPIEFHPVVLS